jgi:hypothetical protein
MKKLSILAGALLACALMPAGAQTIYRCGDTYSQLPCDNARVVGAPAAKPGAAEAQASRQAVVRDAARADAMEKARLKDEARPANAYIPAARTGEERAQEHKPASAQAKKPAYFTAVSRAASQEKAKGKKKEKKDKKAG